MTIAVTYLTFTSTSNTELGNLAFFPVIAEETDTLNRNVTRGTMQYAIHLLWQYKPHCWLICFRLHLHLRQQGGNRFNNRQQEGNHSNSNNFNNWHGNNNCRNINVFHLKPCIINSYCAITFFLGSARPLYARKYTRKKTKKCNDDDNK